MALTGSDVNESSLGNVPSASNATIAGAAVRAGSAASVDRVSVSGQARANFGDPPRTILTAGAWRMDLNCDDDNSSITLVNISSPRSSVRGEST